MDTDHISTELQDLIKLAGGTDEISRRQDKSADDLKNGLKSFLNDFITPKLEKYNNIVYCSLPFWWHQDKDLPDGNWFGYYIPLKFFEKDIKRQKESIATYIKLYLLLDKKAIPFSFSDFACRSLAELPRIIMISIEDAQEDAHKENKITSSFSRDGGLLSVTFPKSVRDKVDIITPAGLEDYLQLLNLNGDVFDAIKEVQKYCDIRTELSPTVKFNGLNDVNKDEFLRDIKLRATEGKEKSAADINKLKESFIEFIGANCKLFPDLKYIVYAPSKIFKYSENLGKAAVDHSFGGVIAVINKSEGDGNQCLDEMNIPAVFDQLWLKTTIKLREWASWDWAEKVKSEIRRHSSKSAIAAIMSRNGSHNIGSHVIAAVTNNLNDLPDDQILFSYIQHRMDFIATITTEFPQWSYPVWFVKDLMRRFYMQRHLLNYIALSEELRAFEPQNFHDKDQNSGRLVLKIRVKGENGTFTSVIDPKSKDISTEGKVEKDVLVAIPGGIIGHQAFYTVLENIIRNSAKHGYAAQSPRSGNLEITIDVIDDIKNDFVIIRIWDNISDIKCVEIEANRDLPNDPGAIYWENGPSKDQEKFNVLPLHQKMNCRLCRSFIDRETGDLKRENWGLAEMKISAGYLNRKEVTDISEEGAPLLFRGDGDGKPGGIIRATTHTQTENGASVKRLAFEFALPRPREVLIVGYDADVTPEFKARLRRHSVYLEKKVPWSDLDYEMVVLCSPEFLEVSDKTGKTEEQLQKERLDNIERFPARLFVVGKEIEGLPGRKIVYLKKEDLGKHLLDINGVNAKVEIERFKLWLYACWVDNVHKRVTREEGNTLQLVIKMTGKDGKSYDEQLMRKMFELTKDSYPPLISHINNKRTDDITKMTKLDWKELDWDYLKSQSDIPEALAKHWMSRAGLSRQMKAKGFWVDFCRKFARNLKERIYEKYGEEMETLPRNYRARNRDGEMGKTWNNSYQFPDETDTILAANITDQSRGSDEILYVRHLRIQRGVIHRYYESISGSQIYFSNLLNVPEDQYLKKKTILELLENGLLRFVIVDERLYDFVHASSGADSRINKFHDMNVHVFKQICSDDKENASVKDLNCHLDVSNGRVRLNCKGKSDDKENAKEFDVLIIHQGILDKTFAEEEKSREFLDKAKNSIAIVIITSGRGMPDRLPANVKFLPFANIESFLMKEYPEKFLLSKVVTKIVK